VARKHSEKEKHETLTPVAAQRAQQLIAAGAVPVDVREAYEHNAEHIAGDVLHPLSALPSRIDTGGQPAIFYCRSGTRTRQAEAELAARVSVPSYVLDGGIMGWKRAGLATEGGGRGAIVGADLLRRLLSSLTGKK
jgi:rhodanese-related sulfurtransferase